jgi:hypothetical protein
VGVGALAGTAYGVLLRAPGKDLAHLGDRGLGLSDRLATAVELLASPNRGPLDQAAIRDACRVARDRDWRPVVRWRVPREARMIPVAAVALGLLAYLPPIPIPGGELPPLHRTTEVEPEKPKGAPAQAMDRPVPKRGERAERTEQQDRQYQVRPNPLSEQARGDLAAVFKDTSVAQKRPDFSSFLKQGDDRLRLLERPDNLPDLQRDFTQTPYKVMFRKAQDLLTGDPRQVSRERMRQLLDEMNRIGRRGTSGSGDGDFGQDLMDGTEALEQGQMSRAMDAMERALSKLRSMEQRERGGRRLDGGRDGGGSGREQGRSGPGEEGDADFGEGHGSLPGKGTNPQWRGDPTTRLDQDPLDVGVEGEARKGRKEAYDTNLLGRGASNRSRLPSLSVYGEYRKLMEEALAKENIPLDYRSQVKQYFESLEDR